MYHIAVDDYVVDVLLPDLAGHDRSPAAFLVYLILWTHLFRAECRTAAVSLQSLSAQTGLSKSAVQAAIRLLRNRSLIRVSKTSRTAVPEYELIRHWLRRRANKS
jgi:DNA-binding GntR family transcriptional regulator